VVAYGKGDPAAFLWEQAARFAPHGDGWWPAIETTLPANTKRSRVTFIQKHHKCSVFLAVSTAEELKSALKVSDIVAGVVVAGVKGAPLAATLAVRNKFKRVMIRSTACDRRMYLSRQDFKDQFGLEAALRQGCGFRPCLEDAHQTSDGLFLYLRACFGSRDSQGEIFLPKLDKGGWKILNGSDGTLNAPAPPFEYGPPRDWAILREAAHRGLSCANYREQKRWWWGWENPNRSYEAND
jgi:hypothetical protein